MTTTFLSLVPSKYLENTQTAQYTASGVKAIIDKAVVTNVSSSNATLNLNHLTGTGTLNDSNLIIKDKIIAPGKSYLCPEITGIVLNSADYISTLASVSSALVFNLSGREIS